MKNLKLTKYGLTLLLGINGILLPRVIAQNAGFELNMEHSQQDIYNYDDGERNYKIRFNLSKFPVGHPDIKAMSALILIPNGTELNIECSPGTVTSCSELEVKPVPPHLEEGYTGSLPPEDTYKDQTIYSQNQDYPGIFYRVTRIGKIRGQEAAMLYVFPYQYNPVLKRNCLYGNLSIAVEYDGQILSLPTNLLSDYDPNGSKPINLGFTGEQAINAEQVIELELEASPGKLYDKSIIPGCQFLIITQNILNPAAEKLKKFKESMGITTQIKTYSSKPSEATVESYINSCYDSMDPVPRYILILGDVNIIPYSTKITGKITDLPYFDRDDLPLRFPDFCGGRIPVSTSTQANNWINKIIRYEEIAQNDPFFSKAAIASFFKPTEEGSGIEMRRYIRTSEELAMLFANNFIDFDRLYYSDESAIDYYTNVPQYLMSDDIPGAPIPAIPSSWDADHDEIIQSINDERFLVVHRGHGNEISWGTGDFDQFNVSDVSNLTNANYPSVFWSINCLTGNFAYSPECIAEKLGRYTGGGAVAVIAATDETETMYNDYLVHGLAQAVWPQFLDWRCGTTPSVSGYGFLRMGDILINGLLHLLTVYQNDGNPDPGAENHINCYQLLGDPTMEILPYPNCVPSRTVGSATISSGDVRLYDHTEQLQNNGSFVVNSGGDVYFRAGDKIVLKTGFKILAGGHFLGTMEECYDPEKSLSINSNSRGSNEGSVNNNPENLSSSENNPVVYPNPTNGILYIEFETLNEASIITVYNQLGTVALNKSMVKKSDFIDLSDYPDGVYILRLANSHNSWIVRILKGK